MPEPFPDPSAGHFCYVPPFLHLTMSEVLNKQICLALNRAWMCLDFRSVRKATEDITSINPTTGQPPFLFLDLTYDLNPDGSHNTEVLLNARPVSVDEWLALPVRGCDLAINCGTRQLRAPTLIVATNYADVPVKTPKFSSEAIRERDGNICQATKRKLAPGEGDLGHDIAKAHGGKRSWQNIAWIDKRLNREQGTRTFREMGWDIKPAVPKPRRVFFTADDARHPSHLHFVERN